MLLERDRFLAAGGFNEAYQRQFEDYDLCQRLRTDGAGVVCVPDAGTISHEADSDREQAFDVVDRALFVDLWYEELRGGDPFYNENFSQRRADYSLEEDSFLPTPLVSTWSGEEQGEG